MDVKILKQRRCAQCLRTWPPSDTGPRFMLADMTQNNFPPADFDLVIGALPLPVI